MSLFAEFEAYRKAQGEGLAAPQASELLIRVGRHVSRFLGVLFGVERELASLAQALTGELPLFDYKREFVTRRVYKKGAPERPTATTRAPSRTKARAAASPIPAEAPVIRTRRPSKRPGTRCLRALPARSR